MKRGLVFDIQRFSTHDGPGIRTTVFLKGCPLSCAWCHNPESQSSHCELFFHKEICIDCGSCDSACPWGNARHILANTQLRMKKCNTCCLCAKACPSKAIEVVGKYYTSDEIIDEIKKDKAFYSNTNGGLTVSGGEPLFQYDFTKDVLRKAKNENIHTTLETSGYTTTEKIIGIMPFVDLFLWDIKAPDDNTYKKYTGVSFQPILRNIKLADKVGANIIIRLILVPKVNMNNKFYDFIVDLRSSLNHIRTVEVIPYHDFGIAKKEKLGVAVYDMFDTPNNREIEKIRSIFS